MSSTDRDVNRRLKRDGQQWFYDWMIQETGKVFQFQTDGRGALPRAVRRHAMISKHLGLAGRRMEAIANEELAAEHRVTALNRFFDASSLFMAAQHTIFENNAEKRYLHGSLMRCYQQVTELAPYKIEHIDVPWNGTTVSGNLHLCPGADPRACIFFIPGCDLTKEAYPHPQMNHALQRGMHLFSFDGPGQGESNLRGIRLTHDNYELAASAVIDHLLERPDIHPDRLCVYGVSFGSYWALRLAAHDKRVRAVAAPWASYGEKYTLMDVDAPRWKQLFIYLTQAGSEAELDEVMRAMSLQGVVDKIECPTLEVCGEYDPRSPLEEVYELFDELTCPAELWVFADQHHKVSLSAPNSDQPAWMLDIHMLALDWLADRLAGQDLRDERRVTYVEAGRGGPVGATASDRRRWYESS